MNPTIRSMDWIFTKKQLIEINCMETSPYLDADSSTEFSHLFENGDINTDDVENRANTFKEFGQKIRKSIEGAIIPTTQKPDRYNIEVNLQVFQDLLDPVREMQPQAGNDREMCLEAIREGMDINDFDTWEMFQSVSPETVRELLLRSE